MMEWVKIFSEMLGRIAWPATLITLIIMFRREIRQRVTAVSEVKYPGGSIVMREVAKLEAKIEENSGLSFPGQASPSIFIPTIQHIDSRLAIAQMRLDAEKELFLLSRYALNVGDIAGWHVDRYLEELEKADALNPSLADSVRDFLALANKIIHDSAAIPDVLVQRSAAVGSSLVATLHHKRLVFAAERDFEGHGLWHMHHHREEGNKKHYFWSAVAACLPEFEYNYDVYHEAAERYNSKLEQSNRKAHVIYVLPLEEFVSVLEFREKELLRIINLWRSGQGWGERDAAIEWQWPASWGNIGWRGPILHERRYLWGAEEDLMHTRAALAYYRHQVLSLRRSEVSSGEMQRPN